MTQIAKLRKEEGEEEDFICGRSWVSKRPLTAVVKGRERIIGLLFIEHFLRVIY